MKAGELRHAVTFEQKVETRDEFGGVVETWADYDWDYASIEPLKGRERFLAQQVQADVTALMRMRYREDITSALRVREGTSIYEIDAVFDPEKRGRELHLMLKEVM